MDAARLLKTADVAERLGLSAPTVRGLFARGELSGRRLNGHWYTTEAAIADFLAGFRGGEAFAPLRVPADPGMRAKLRALGV